MDKKAPQYRVCIRRYSDPHGGGIERNAIEVYHHGILDYSETKLNVPDDVVDEIVTMFCKNPQYEIRDERIKKAML